ncbi:response regulator transcription factor [Terrabacter aerolatus]|uniref:DNA-binding response regulator n=1 Tax=Terrabacter aerolatus TaxID=422442 RepID=A0A512D1R3_9MICO|nr:response regulator transcription factor [Terrabacter aerolatus]GEO30190.1 DNA-binding response regulator [Terrabacter aerolatus]
MDRSADHVTTPITVFLLDDHEIVRRGLIDLLESHDGFRVVGEAGTAAEALRRIPTLTPQVALLDARLPDGSGIDVCREVQVSSPGTRCLILTSYDDDDALFAAVMAGASGYLLKQIRGPSLTEAVAHVAAGHSLIDPALVERLLERIRRPGDDAADASHDAERAGAGHGGRPGHPAQWSPADSLTDREQEILGLIAEGLTNRQIGARLHLAEKTVKNYVSGLLAKLGFERRTQAAVYGAQHGHDPGAGTPPGTRPETHHATPHGARRAEGRGRA